MVFFVPTLAVVRVSACVQQCLVNSIPVHSPCADTPSTRHGGVERPLRQGVPAAAQRVSPLPEGPRADQDLQEQAQPQL